MSKKDDAWKWVFGICIILLIALIVAARITGYWVLTALPVGFLFGFFLEKGDLCGASAFSEVIVLKSWKKVQGIWMVIVVSMLGFALLNGLGLVKLNPKPLLWASYIIGGILFGAGMVLAGGCVSGSLYKTGQGNINSMAALAGIPIGIMLVEHGPLNAFHKILKTYLISNADGSPVTFSAVLHLPYGLLAILFALMTAGAVIFFNRKRDLGEMTDKSSNESILKRVVTKKWQPWQAGIAIGLIASLAYLSSAASGRNYPLGVTHGVMHAELLLIDRPLTYIYAPKTQTPEAQSDNSKPKKVASGKKVSVWLIFEILALVLGAFVSAKLSGRAKLLPKPPGQTLTAFFGGLLVGTGAAIAGGCVVGNIMSGMALMSVGNVLFAGVVILTNWVATHFYLMGGGTKDLVWATTYFKSE